METYVLIAMFEVEAWKLRVLLIDLKLLLRRERRGEERDVCRRLWMMRGIFGKVGQLVVSGCECMN